MQEAKIPTWYEHCGNNHSQNTNFLRFSRTKAYLQTCDIK
jgi:hypothetical protein